MTSKRRIWTTAIIGALAAVIALPNGGAAAADSVSYTRKGSTYEEVRQDLEDAIIAEGLKIDYNGNIGAMLQRTGRDVGSNVPVYAQAEFLTFCSAKLSRQMMEADPANLAQCPYVMFIYQRAATVKDVTVGYRKVAVQGRAKKALEEINAMLERIARKVAK